MDRNEQLMRARHNHTDALVAPDSLGMQNIRHVIDRRVELRIAERPDCRHYRGPLTGHTLGQPIDPHILRNGDIKH
jgi:hypothetical protein